VSETVAPTVAYGSEIPCPSLPPHARRGQFPKDRPNDLPVRLRDGDPLDEIAAIQHGDRSGGHERPRRPMIVLRSPKGGTGPAEVDGLPVTGTCRAHQVPLSVVGPV
jgi:XFP N-terminal domain